MLTLLTPWKPFLLIGIRLGVEMPHPLDGCYAKIQRAEEHIKNLKTEITAFLARDPKPYQIVRQFQNNGLQYAFIAKGDPVVPMRFSVVVGEVFHQLRSSLDHLVCALVLKNGKRISSSHQFPICTKAEHFDKAVKSGAIKGITSSARDLILSVQPYKTADPDDTVLNVVRQFNNLDKHTMLLVTCTAAQLGERITITKNGPASSITGMGPPNPVKITKEGAVIFSFDLGSPDPEFEAEAEFASDIAFEKCGRVELAPVIQTLNGIWQGTFHTLNIFKNEF